ncbi:MAG: hypothetical protein U9Q81_22035, partial [Pseudomonadota bacterium]|nr:hypothetical protein [Pseudomonadota bacterium]
MIPRRDLTEIAKVTQSEKLDHVSALLALGSQDLRMIQRGGTVAGDPELAQSIFIARLLSSALALSVVMVYLSLAYAAVPPASDWLLMGTAAGFLWAVVALSLEWRLRLHRLRLAQNLMDRAARDLAGLVEARDTAEGDEPVQFVLYLRAFATTDKLHINGIDLETALAYSLAPLLPVVALGQPGEHVGAGCLASTDEAWQSNVQRLIADASLILAIPSAQPGTLWEMNYLKESGHFGNTIFLMPPELPFLGGRYSRHWEAARTALKPRGILLPPHFKKGLLFRLDENGRSREHAPFGIEHLVPIFRDYGGGDTSNETEEAAEENETEQAFEGDADSAIADELDAADG